MISLTSVLPPLEVVDWRAAFRRSLSAVSHFCRFSSILRDSASSSLVGGYPSAPKDSSPPASSPSSSLCNVSWSLSFSLPFLRPLLLSPDELASIHAPVRERSSSCGEEGKEGRGAVEPIAR